MKRRFLALGALGFPFFLASCAGSPIAIARDTNEQLRTEQTINLCRAYPMFLDRSGVRAELSRRLAVSDPEWVLIDQRKIYVGMTECALLASWGSPEKQERDTTLRGENVRYVYHGGADIVYVNDGKVTSFQRAH